MIIANHYIPIAVSFLLLCLLYYGISFVKIGPVEVKILYDTKYWPFCLRQLVLKGTFLLFTPINFLHAVCRRQEQGLRPLTIGRIINSARAAERRICKKRTYYRNYFRRSSRIFAKNRFGFVESDFNKKFGIRLK